MSIFGAMVYLRELAASIARTGPVGALLVLLAGLLLLLFGHRAFRPTAALLAALVAALAVREAIERGELRLAMPERTAMWGGGLVAIPVALIWPALATILACGVTAFFVAMHITPRNDPDMALFVWTASVALGMLVPAVMWNYLPAFVVPIVGSAITTMGVWGYIGVKHAAWQIYKVPVLWIVVWIILMVASGWMENTRLERAMAKRNAAKGGGGLPIDARPRPKAKA